MFVRVMRPEDKDMMELIQSVAFESPWEPPKPESEPESEPDPMVWWMCGEGETAHSCLGVLPIRARFDGRIVELGGIGGVASLPQYRRKGGIRALMNAVLRDMYERGFVFSGLYPFSRAYYKKFGYTDGGTAMTWTIPFSAFDLPDMGGSCEMLMPGGDLTALKEVYAAASAGWNLSNVEASVFNYQCRKNWMKERRYIYVWRDENNVPAGAMMMSKKDGVMDCTTSFALSNFFLFRDVRALTALMNFGKRFAADYSAIKFTVPYGVRVDSLISEGNEVKCEAGYNGMIRVVNAKTALEMRACRGEGSVKIAVADEILPENTGVWRVDFGPGENRVQRVDETPDVEMSIGALSQLLTGVRCAEDIPMMPEVRVLNPKADFGGVFCGGKCFFLDLY